MARSSLYVDIAKSVEKTLADEARRNELMLASVRTLALGLITLLNITMYLVVRGRADPLVHHRLVLADLGSAVVRAVVKPAGRPPRDKLQP